jgi:hypothetical protein
MLGTFPFSLSLFLSFFLSPFLSISKGVTCKPFLFTVNLIQAKLKGY